MNLCVVVHLYFWIRQKCSVADKLFIYIFMDHWDFFFPVKFTFVSFRLVLLFFFFLFEGVCYSLNTFFNVFCIFSHFRSSFYSLYGSLSWREVYFNLVLFVISCLEFPYRVFFFLFYDFIYWEWGRARDHRRRGRGSSRLVAEQGVQCGTW